MRGYVDRKLCWFQDCYMKRPRMRNYAAIADSTYKPLSMRTCLNCRDRGVCGEEWFIDGLPEGWPLVASCWEPEQTMEPSWRIRMDHELRQAALAGGLEKVG